MDDEKAKRQRAMQQLQAQEIAPNGSAVANSIHGLADEMAAGWKQGGAGGLGRMVGVAAKATPVLAASAVDDVVDNPFTRGVVDAGKGFVGGLTGWRPSEKPAATPAPSPAPAALAASPAAHSPALGSGRIGQEVDAASGRAAAQPVSSPSVDRSAVQSAAAAPAQTDAVRLAENVYRHAPGVYSDGTGQIKPTEVRAGGLGEGNGISSGAASAQRVADIYRSMVSDQSAGGVNVPQVLHSGNSWAAANELRNARVSANSITNQGRFSKWGNQASPAQLEYAALLARDADARKAGFGLQQEGMRQAGNIRQEGIRQAGHLQQEQARQVGGLHREALSQAGANYRADQDAALQARSQAETERNGAVQREMAELNLQQAKELDGLYKMAEMARTPEERRMYQQRHLARAGQIAEEARDHVITAGGGQQYDPTSGQVLQVPQRLYNVTRNQWIEPPGSSFPPGMRQVGTSNGLPVYEDAQGKRQIYSPGGLG